MVSRARPATLTVLLSIAGAACSAPEPDPPGTMRTWSYDDVANGSLPPGFKSDATHRTEPLADWAVRAVADAPSPPNVLSLPKVEHGSGDVFNLCWTDDLAFLDGTLTVKLCARAGKEDTGGGLMWRVRGRNNYYVARYNPLERNLRLYHVAAGRRTMIASADVELPAGWHELRVEQRGTHIAVALDGTPMLAVTDDTFPHAGGIGLWTKADATTDFDDLRVEFLGAAPR